MAATSQAATAAAARQFADAHRALLADRSTQFTLRPTDPPPNPPEWLQTIGDWIAWALRPIGTALGWLAGLVPDAPYARVLFWTVVALASAALAWVVVDRIRHGDWRWRWRRTAAAAPAETEWAPAADPARQWLREADALAADGRYAEAVHHLLIRSVEDVARRRPRLVRPALTSRDIAAAEGLPAAARAIFHGIARTVERSLFGGRAVDADDWTAARTSYAEFALAKAWR